MQKRVIRYSEAFKRQVVDEIERGKFATVMAAQRGYGIKGSGTVWDWVRRYGREDLHPHMVRIQTMKERDELKEARDRIRKLEAALSDAHVDNLLGKAFLHVACERMGTTPEEFKKKHAITLSDLRRNTLRGLQ